MSTALRRLHPDFAQYNEREDVLLVAQACGTSFAVPRTALARVSAFFRTMFTLPQSTNIGQMSIDPISVSENAATLQYVAAYATGTTLPPVRDASHIEDILSAADKYDMPGLISIMRLALSAAVTMPPIRRYVAAKRYGWQDLSNEAEAAYLAWNLRMQRSDLDVRDDDLVLVKPLLQKKLDQQGQSSSGATVRVDRRFGNVPTVNVGTTLS